MHRTAAIAAALTLIVTTVGSQPATTDFSADRFKAHVAFLADDLLEGREAGTRGHEIAARYIATEFELLGVKPGGRNGSYFESVDLIETTLTGPTPTVTVKGASAAQTFEHRGKVTIAGPIGGGEVKLHAPLVFVGYGVHDAALGYDDYKDLDVRGKIAVILLGSPKGMDSEIGAHLLSEQLHTASEHGARAVIRVPSKAMAAAFPWERLAQFGDEPVTMWVQKDGTPFNRAKGLEAAAVMETTAAAALFDGAPETLAQVLDEADRNGGRPKGFALKATAEFSVTTSARRFASPEVIGIIEGSDSRLKSEYVALMAHADHIGIRRGATEGDRINNGALDNAAGIATLLEAARAFTAGAQRPRRSILIVANTAEEKGLLGADYFAHNPTVPIDSITAAIDLDMPLITYDFSDVVAYGATHSTLDEAFRNATADMDVLLSPDPMPEQAVFVRSDHYAMVRVGVPAVMLATGMANGGKEAWATYLGTRYHRPSDDLSQPIRWNAGARFAELNYRVARALADADGRAQWYANDYFGNLFAPKAPKAAKASTR